MNLNAVNYGEHILKVKSHFWFFINSKYQKEERDITTKYMVLKNITLYILSKTLPTSFYILAIHWEQSHVWGLVVRKESWLAESSLKWFLQKPISQI